MNVPLRTRHDAALLLQALLNPSVTRLLACLPARPGEHRSAEAVAQRYGDPREAVTLLARCVALGAVRREPDGYYLDRERVTALAAGLTADSPLELTVDGRPALRPFVRAGRLEGWPSRPAVEDELFAALAGLFAPGSTWAEVDVTATLAEVLDDPAAARRGLVDRGLLLREVGGATYRVPAAPDPL